jgi:hypothetical protein
VSNVKIIYRANTFGPWNWSFLRETKSGWESCGSSITKRDLPIDPSDTIIHADDGPDDPPLNADGSCDFYREYPNGTYCRAHIPAKVVDP